MGRPIPTAEELRGLLALVGVSVDDESLPGLERRVAFYQEAMSRLDEMDFGLTEPAVVYDPDASPDGS